LSPRTALHSVRSSLNDSPCQNPVNGPGKVIIINADDIGMHAAIDDATVLLAEMKRVSSASVMSLGAPGKDVITELSRLNVDLGLHLDFTSVFANRRYDADRSVRSLIMDTWSRRMDVTQVQHIVNDQLQRFEMITGRAPTFIDGHQHVHQFPVIRDGLIQALAIRHPRQKFFIRNTGPATWRGFKAWLIGALGTPGLLGLAARAGHASNVDFCGVYDFSEHRDMSRSWRSWLASSPPCGGLVMCHPALTSQPDDVIGKARVNEFRFLRSEQFSELIDDAGIEIAGWNGHQRR
jgi:predicted glycoside hydrolase/deacetylase ChbG (UPF0249 family)